MSDKTEAQTIADLAILSADVFEIEGVPAQVLPAGATVRLFEELLPAPKRIQAKRAFATQKDFSAYLTDFADPAVCRIYADEAECFFVAILDHYAKDAPAWGSHVATLALELSPEWQAWKKRHRAWVPQADFADFLEDHIEDVVEPDGAVILQVAKHLESHRTVRFQSGVNLQNGTIQLTYIENETAQGKANLKVPAQFVLGIPYYDGDDPTRVDGRLRYRISDKGELSFQFLLDKLERIARNCFTTACGFIRENTGCRLYLGTP